MCNVCRDFIGPRLVQTWIEEIQQVRIMQIVRELSTKTSIRDLRGLSNLSSIRNLHQKVWRKR